MSIARIGVQCSGGDTGSATAGGAATALVLATSRHVASTGRFELGGEAVEVAVRAIRATGGRR
jgi:hypothetical protein